jgi:hypothetical protein
LGGQGGRQLEEILTVMAKWSPRDDDLILLRRSIGMHANPDDIKHLDPAMVQAYNQTSYAKVRDEVILSKGCPPLAPARLSFVFRHPGQCSLCSDFRLTIETQSDCAMGRS